MKTFGQYRLVLESFSDFRKLYIMKYNIPQDEVDSYIEKYKKLNNNRQLKTPENDIGYWIQMNDFEEFKNFVDAKETEHLAKQPLKKLAKMEDAPIVFQNDAAIVYKILSKAASCKLGSDTDWCITKGHQSYYEQYTRKGANQFYFIFSKLPDDLRKLAVAVEKDGSNYVYDRSDKGLGSLEDSNLKPYIDSLEIPLDIFKPSEQESYLERVRKNGKLHHNDDVVKDIESEWPDIKYNETAEMFQFDKPLKLETVVTEYADDDYPYQILKDKWINIGSDEDAWLNAIDWVFEIEEIKDAEDYEKIIISVRSLIYDSVKKEIKRTAKDSIEEALSKIPFVCNGEDVFKGEALYLPSCRKILGDEIMDNADVKVGLFIDTNSVVRFLDGDIIEEPDLDEVGWRIEPGLSTYAWKDYVEDDILKQLTEENYPELQKYLK